MNPGGGNTGVVGNAHPIASAIAAVAPIIFAHALQLVKQCAEAEFRLRAINRLLASFTISNGGIMLIDPNDIEILVVNMIDFRESAVRGCGF